MGVNKVIFGGNTIIDITDTTAENSDVSSGKDFYSAAGVKTSGRASAPSYQAKTATPTGSSQVITPDAGYDALSSVTVGASNYVSGTFTTGSSAGVSSVTIPYTGNGYPIACVIHVEGGAYNSAVSGWYTSVQRYAVGVWGMTKSVMTSTPTYTTSGSANQAVTWGIYKNSTSSSTSYSRTSAMSTNTFSSSNASNAVATVARFKSATSLSIYTNTSSYGFLPSTTYRYHIIYSE